jgi:hypothetical protein
VSFTLSLSDPDLIICLGVIGKKPHLLRDWEQSFCRDLPSFYVKSGALTWKQRKSARSIIERVMVTLAGIFNRPDLVSFPQQIQVYPPVSAYPHSYPVTSLVPTPPPAMSPEGQRIEADSIARMMSSTALTALIRLGDGKPYPTARTTTENTVCGVSIPKLKKLGLVTSSFNGALTMIEITLKGHRVLEAHERAKGQAS